MTYLQTLTQAQIAKLSEALNATIANDFNDPYQDTYESLLTEYFGQDITNGQIDQIELELQTL